MYSNKQLINIKETVLKELTEGKSLNTICKDNNIQPTQVYRMLNKDTQFCDNYTHAREQQALFYAEKIDKVINDLKDIANESINDIDTDINAIKSKKKYIRELTDISRLEIDSLKWVSSKLLPKIYGSNVQNNTQININSEPITGMRIISTEDK